MEFTRTFMTDSPPPAETHQTVRAKRLERRIRRAEWRQSCFTLVSAGHSYAEVAKRLMVSERSVRRDVARAIDERRLDAPERYIHRQVDRLTRALRAADDRIERGDMKAVSALIKLIAALDRYHGLDARARRELMSAPSPEWIAPRLALGAPAEDFTKLSESDVQAFEEA
jgi:hypothetical protein